MSVRKYQDSDWADLFRMEQALFPGDAQVDAAELRSFLARPDAAVFMALRPDGSVCGFVEAGTRSIADGCDSSPVGYVEAWYVEPDVRRAGHGSALLAAAEAWARGMGYREMASDVLIDNKVSEEAHVRSGYQIVDRVITFRKSLALILVAFLLGCSADFGEPIPAGPEALEINATAFALAPGREAWIHATTFIQTSPTTLEPVRANVQFSISNFGVANVIADTGGYARIVGRTPGTATITIRSLRDPKNVKTATVTVAAAPAANDAGLTYTASAVVRPVASVGGAPISLGPYELDVSATITNPTSATRDVWLSGCPVSIRIYVTADRSGTPLADATRGAQCSASPRHVTLVAGASETVAASGDYTLRDTLPEGTVYVVAAVDRLRDVLDVLAGPITLVSPNAGLTFTAATTVSGTRLAVHATVKNTNAESVRIEYGDCAIALLGYKTADRSGKPAWNSDARLDYATKSPFGCLLYAATGVIRAAETLSPAEFNRSFAIPDLLGDSLPSAHYYFKALVRLNGRQAAVLAGDADVKR